MKEEIVRFNSLFSACPASEETRYFLNQSHDALIQQFMKFVRTHEEHLLYMRPTNQQALNDRGVDILVQNDRCKIGVQIKSHGDVVNNDFARNVKRQYAESKAYGLDKWYLLVCCSYEEGLEMKVNHLFNEFNNFKTDDFKLFGPKDIVHIFRDPGIVTSQRLRQVLTGTTAAVTTKAKNLKRMNAVLDWGHTDQELLNSVDLINEFYDDLIKMSLPSREFYSKLLEKAQYIRSLEQRYEISCQEVANWYGFSSDEIITQVNVLSRYHMAHIEDEDGYGIPRVILKVRDKNHSWIPQALKEFSEKSGVKLQDLLCHLRFDHLDD